MKGDSDEGYAYRGMFKLQMEPPFLPHDLFHNELCASTRM
jgi:hypothetical protein